MTVWMGLMGLAAVARAEHYRFRHFGPDDGLNTSVTSLLQDRQGFLWVGSGNGLYRYDGAHFQRFGTAEGLPNASIRALEEAPDGVLWIVTGAGLARWRNNTFDKAGTGEAVRDLRGMNIDAGGTIYLATDRGVLS